MLGKIVHVVVSRFLYANGLSRIVSRDRAGGTEVPCEVQSCWTLGDARRTSRER